MKLSVTHLALAGTLCLAGACGPQHTEASAPGGKIRIKGGLDNAAHANTGTSAICADFTITAYSFPTAGGAPQAAGNPVTFSTNSNSTAIDQILGCIDNKTHNYAYTRPAGSIYVNGSYNWAYLVSAANFVHCDNPANLPASANYLDQTTVNPAPAYFAPVNCDTSNDVQLNIDYPIAIASVSPTGDIDISAAVDPTTTYIGCKNADIDPVTGDLHFAQSNAIDTKSAAPQGLIGFKAAADHNLGLIQYGGQTWAADPATPSSTMYNTFYSGQFVGSLPTSSSIGYDSSFTLFQTFLTNSDETHLLGATGQGADGACGTGEWVDSRHAFCLTQRDGALGTQGMLADAFLYYPGTTQGHGYAAAKVAGGSVSVYSQMVANSSTDYTSVSGPAVIMTGATGFTSTAASHARGAFNDSLAIQGLNAQTIANNQVAITAVYIDPTNKGQFLLGVTKKVINPSTDPDFNVVHNGWATLSADLAGNWTVGAYQDFAPMPAGFGVSASGCIP